MTAAEKTTVKSACSYCGVGCGMLLQIATDPQSGRRRVATVTGDKEHPANFGRLCTKGATSAEMLRADGRLHTARVRPERGTPLQTRATAAAITDTGRRLRAIIDEHGPDAVALYVSGQMSLEAQYLANKLAKGFIGTSHIESNSRLCMSSAATGYKLSLGADGPPGSYQDFDRADVFLVVGANMADCHPILYLRMMDRVRAGAKLIVVDPRRTATAERADLFLQIAPGTDLALFNGLLHLIVENGHLDTEFIDACTQGWGQLPAFLADYDPATVSSLTGLAPDDLRTAAQWIGEAGEWMSCWTMGLNQSTHGTWNTNALINLHLATGAICRPGSGPFSLTGQPNAMGGRDMGYLGSGLPGQRSIDDPDDRAFTEQVWGLSPGTLRSDGGTGTIDMFRSMADGDIKACWIIGTNPVASVAGRGTVIAGLERAEFVVAQDVFEDTETTGYADVLLPATLWAESTYVTVNSERNLTLLEQAADPVGEALPDWRIIAEVARAMGYGASFCYETVEDVFAELTLFANPKTGYDLRGITYERLRRTPVQWPSPPSDAERDAVTDDGRNPRRYLTAEVTRPRFPTPSGRAVFFARPHLDAHEMPDDDYPFVLNTGRLPHQWHTMTKTGKVDRLNRLDPAPFVELHAADAEQLAVADGDRLQIASRRGRAVLPARISERVQRGSLFAPFHWNDVFGEYLAVNAVTGDATDPLSFQPGFKACAVAVTKVALARDGGLPTRRDSPSASATRSASGAASRPLSNTVVLWASQTGNAQQHAVAVAARLRERGHALDLVEMGAFEATALADTKTVLLVTSTFGDGDSPDDGEAFWSALSAETAPPLNGVRYAVLALGDSSYSTFCGHGRRLDARMAELGATRLTARADCDAGDGASADAWYARIEAAMATDAVSSGAAAPTDAPLTPAGSILAAPAPTGSIFSSPEPTIARVSLNRRLGDRGSTKDVRQYSLAADAQLHYRAGDVLSVRPRNSRGAVDAWLAATRLDGHTLVRLDGLGELPLAEAATHHLEIVNVGLGLLRFIGRQTGDRDLATMLRPDDKLRLRQWLWGRQAIDVLHEYPVVAEASEWVSALERLQPRRYSISSSPLAHPHDVQLTVSSVRFEYSGQPRNGVCSTFLADHSGGADIPVLVRPTAHFRPPADPQQPIIMVGPGTGIAPFRAFLQERQHLGHAGPNWLFFGERHAATDFYYREELEKWARDGLLTRLSLAFSRDQRQKIYVQDRMREQGSRLWAWIQDGASFYVCGDAGRMARDVDRALRDIARTHGRMSAEDADAFIAELTRQKRYVRDVY